jgi:hypothetical protein
MSFKDRTSTCDWHVQFTLYEGDQQRYDIHLRSWYVYSQDCQLTERYLVQACSVLSGVVAPW